MAGRLLWSLLRFSAGLNWLGLIDTRVIDMAHAIFIEAVEVDIFMTDINALGGIDLARMNELR
jgi:hypothetical protein